MSDKQPKSLKERTEQIDIKKLNFLPDNYRIHNEKQIDFLVERLKNKGQTRPLTVSKKKLFGKSNVVIAGNGTLEAMQKLKLKKADIIYMDLDTEAEAIAESIADNNAYEMGIIDYPKLAVNFQKIQTIDDKLLALTGYESEQINYVIKTIDNPLYNQNLNEYKFQHEYIEINELKEHPQNYKQYTDKQIEHVINNLRLSGIYKNIIITDDNVILNGSEIIQASKKMGIQKIPVIKLNIQSDSEQALKILIFNNEIDKFTDTDDRQLTNLLKDIKDKSDLLGTGFDEMQLANLLFITRPANEIKDKNEANEWVGMPDFEVIPKPVQIIFNFKNETVRNQFVKKYKFPIMYKKMQTWSTQYPYTGKEDLKSLKFDEE